MSLKKRFYFSFSFLVLFMIALGGTLLSWIYQGEGLFNSINQSFQVRQTVRETDSLLQEHNRLLMYFVMFRDNAEKPHIFRTYDSLLARLDAWEKLVDQGWGLRSDLAAVRIECQRLFFLRFQILNLVEQGHDIDAVQKVQKEFLPISFQAEETIKLAAGHIDDDARRMKNESAVLIKRSRNLLMSGAIFSLLLILFFVWDIRRANVPPAGTTFPPPVPKALL